MNENIKEYIWWAIPVVVAAGVGAALYYGRQRPVVEPAQQVQTPAATAAAEPSIKNPIGDDAPADKPLPALNESDVELRDSLGALFGRAVEPYLVPQNIVRNAVVTIDNLPRKKINAQRWPVKPTAGELATRGSEELTLNPDNFARYAGMIKLVENADAKRLADAYKRFYPLFQQAYVDLGYPDGYFNDRLVEVIDHLLETPEPAGPIVLKQPGVFYEFADPELESRSSGQKIMLRMGAQNAAVVKAKLRELRREVAKQSESR